MPNTNNIYSQTQKKYMNSEKKISALWNKFICFLLGHTHTFICERCGKVVNEEDNDNCLKRFRFYLYGHNREYKGSLRIKSGTKKYELDLKTDELRLLEFEAVENEESIERKAVYKPTCVYIDAINDDNAIRKANNYLFGVKRSARITEVTK